MLFFGNGYAVVLLVLVTLSLVYGAFGNERIQTKAFANTIIKSMQVPWIDRIDSVVRSSGTSCTEEIAAMSAAIIAQEMWALEMLDASSKIQSGILKGNLRDLGTYDQCVGANGEYNDTHVQGKHCTVSFGILSSALCVPSSCSETDITEIVNAVVQNVSGITGSEIEINGVSCVRVDSEDFTTGEIITISFFSAVGAFIICCTICEFVKKCRPTGVPSVINELVKFSLYTNAMAMMSTEITPQTMPAIHGLRFLNTCWVVLGHRFVNTLFRPMVNSADILEWYDSWTALYVQVAPFAVDTFFVMSGFLMSYMYLKSKKSGKRSNFPMMYLHRYLRLTPCLAVLILFVAVLLRRVANGPLWNTLLTIHVETCRKNWWLNLLYVQNLVNVDDLCLLHSWYLAVDMQLFWISPFIVYPLHRWPKYGLGLLGLLLLASIVTPAVVLAMNSYSNAAVVLGGTLQEALVNFNHFYIPTYNRACAYFVGILLGFDAANGKRHLSQISVAIYWVVAGILISLCVLATQRIYNTRFEYDMILEIAFALLLRPFWSVAIAWTVYACTFGYGGPLTRFLSLPIFLPLSRLTYCIYLVHMVIQGMIATTAQTPGRFSNFIIVNEMWADLVLSIVVAFIFSLFFESPVIVLEKILTNRGRRRDPVRGTKRNLEGGVDNKGMTGI